MTKLQVKKANFLVPLEEAVSKPAQLLASYLVASLPRSKGQIEDFPQLHFPYRELKRALNADGKIRVNKVDDVMDLGVELQKCILFYENEESKGTVSWLITQDVNKRDSMFTYVLHPGLKKYLLNLESHFTKYNYLFRVCLNAHAMKLYEIFKMYQYLGHVVMHIKDDLKPSLGLVGRYPKTYEFKRRVLNVAQKEMEKYTDIRFEYEVAEKKGKTPISFRFHIYSNKPTELPEKLIDRFKMEVGEDVFEELKIGTPAAFVSNPPIKGSAIYMQLKEWGGNEKSISSLLEKFGTEAIEYQINHLKRIQKQGKKVEKPFAWFRKALQENYQDSVQEKRKEKQEVIKVRQQKEESRGVIEQEIKKMKNAYTKAQMELSDALIKREDNLLDRAIELGRGTLIISGELRKGKTPQEIYEYSFSKFAVIDQIRQLVPEYFERVDSGFKKKIKVLEKRRNAF